MISTLKQNVGKEVFIRLNWGASDFIDVEVVQPLEEEYESYLCRVLNNQGEFKKGSLIEVSQNNLIEVKQ